MTLSRTLLGQLHFRGGQFFPHYPMICRSFRRFGQFGRFWCETFCRRESVRFIRNVVFLCAIKTTAQTAQCCPTPCNTRDRGVGNSTEPPSTAQSFANHSSNLPFSALLLFRGPRGPVRTVAIGEHFCPISSMSGGNFATLDALGESGVSLFVKVLFWGKCFFSPLPLKTTAQTAPRCPIPCSTKDRGVGDST